MSKRNAVSLFAASKDMKKRELQTALQSSLSLRNSILVPTGLTEDVTGVIRSTLFGLRLVAIARNPKDAEFVKTTIAAYQGIISAYGVQPPDLSVQDILTLATSEDINAVAAALGKIIAALPIRPIPVDELHEIFKRATERLDQSV
ncbi:MAG: hypothetical protein A2Z72_06220 [Omnitrophica bacterium RBG_13_46_9]|nr:MAG: hypothetical protein A2Z72_06220 [Omnitrophica bacterium RBG_13_46_9]